MKARLLKKLRKRAYKEIGMLYFVDNDGCDTYNIGFRSRLTTNYSCSADVERTLESAKKRLAWYRREMILKWVEDKWRARLRKRLMDLNKEIIKL
jgi:DNA-binding PucR family transcriptional regulator